MALKEELSIVARGPETPDHVIVNLFESLRSRVLTTECTRDTAT
jgi:hypothetical protein